jgi:hypothetical protein
MTHKVWAQLSALAGVKGQCHLTASENAGGARDAANYGFREKTTSAHSLCGARMPEESSLLMHAEAAWK